jgi:hypothetical protein
MVTVAAALQEIGYTIHVCILVLQFLMPMV